MKLIAVLVVALLGVPSVHACESLRGQWRSDGATTMEYVRRNAKLDDNQLSFLSALMGHMTLDFRPSELRMHIPDLVVPVRGKSQKTAGFDEIAPYRILYCNERVAVIQSTDALRGESVSTYHFIAPDRMWIYGGGNDPSVPDLHIREYFRRIQAEDAGIPAS